MPLADSMVKEFQCELPVTSARVDFGSGCGSIWSGQAMAWIAVTFQRLKTTNA